MPLKVVVIGAVALGPKVACRLKRLIPDAEVIMVDRDDLISYGGCGIPYFVSGDVSEASQLPTTSFHMVRNPEFFRKAKDVTVLNRTEALAIDRGRKLVRIRSLNTGEEQDLGYDKLVIATGSRPNRLPIPGAELGRVFTVANLHDAIAIKELLTAGRVGKAVVLGGGAIGLEMTEALTDLWGVETVLIELQDQLLPGLLNPNLARMVSHQLTARGVKDVCLSEKVVRLEGADGVVQRVVTDKRTIETDLVIMAAGVRPNADLARVAGLEISARGAIKVNSSFQTSDPDIYAGGDCIETLHLVSGQPVYFPSGSLANRQGRIIGTNLAGASEKFDGVVGTAIIKVFDLAVAAAGLSEVRGRTAGFDPFSTFVVQGDRAHFYPEMDLMYLELIADRNTRQVLGIQGLSGHGEALAARINAVAAILKHKPLLSEISNLELAYAPPFAAAMDVLNAVANTAENILAGKNRVIDVAEFAERFAGRADGRQLFLDVRGPANAEPYVKKYPECWLNIPQDQLRERLTELPRDKELILICNSGVRSYEAQIFLDQMGIGPSRNLQGGVAALKKWGLNLT